MHDFLKIQEDHSAKTQHCLPSALIVSKELVDDEQIYQQLQLASTSTSLASMAKFFSKCLVNLDAMSFQIDLKRTNMVANSKSSMSTVAANTTPTDNDSNDGDQDNDDEEEEDEEAESSLDSDGSLDELIKSKLNSSMRATTQSSTSTGTKEEEKVGIIQKGKMDFRT